MAAPVAVADPGPMDPVSAEELSLFNTLREELEATVKDKGSSFFEPKTCAPFTGLVNQGATCYLVSETDRRWRVGILCAALVFGLLDAR
jgi:uncharacterized UBP type Zn finger protein